MLGVFILAAVDVKAQVVLIVIILSSISSIYAIDIHFLLVLQSYHWIVFESSSLAKYPPEHGSSLWASSGVPISIIRPPLGINT